LINKIKPLDLTRLDLCWQQTSCRYVTDTLLCRHRSRRRHWPHFHTACQHVVWEWVQSCRHTSSSTVPLWCSPVTKYKHAWLQQTNS